jgi:hypothetical protein
VTHKQYLAMHTTSEITDILTECCNFLSAQQIAEALAKGCTAQELRIVTREVWLVEDDE